MEEALKELMKESNENAGFANVQKAQMQWLRLPETLKNIRKSKGLTQTALAKKAGISRGMISKIESGVREPRVSTLMIYLSALDINLLDLIKNN